MQDGAGQEPHTSVSNLFGLHRWVMLILLLFFRYSTMPMILFRNILSYEQLTDSWICQFWYIYTFLTTQVGTVDEIHLQSDFLRTCLLTQCQQWFIFDQSLCFQCGAGSRSMRWWASCQWLRPHVVWLWHPDLLQCLTAMCAPPVLLGRHKNREERPKGSPEIAQWSCKQIESYTSVIDVST